jgi:hypothetical protein
LEFLKYWSGSRDFNKLVIKAKNTSQNIYLIFFCFKKYDKKFISFEKFGRMHEN